MQAQTKLVSCQVLGVILKKVSYTRICAKLVARQGVLEKQ